MFCKKVELDFLFETSWEVCNKVGGIYTVLSTKAKSLRTLYNDKLIFVGPDVWTEENPCPEFSELKSLQKKWFGATKLPYGVTARVGRWEIPGRPLAVLVQFDTMYAVKNEFYARMWQRFGVDSLHAYGDYDEACAFSHAAGIVIEHIVNTQGRDARNIIAHFDEWTTGMGLLYVKDRMPRVATVFTTHATSIGRSICGNGKNLYQYFQGYDGDQMARELNMEAKHSLEKAAACNADSFTTVSDITADECEQLLRRRPDVVTPNGFEENFVPEAKTFDKKRKDARRRLLEVANTLTGASLTDDTFIVATSGRCEYRNKGLDMFIDSINHLGDLDINRKVLAFVMVPAWLKDARSDLALNLSLGIREELPAPVYTHLVHNPESDAVLNHIRRLDFGNHSDARVYIVYVPCYLNGSDGIFNSKYYDLLIGMDATVFPSYYEPWGYTPLESIAFGVPTVSTALSGFGRWITTNFDNDIFATGAYITPRTDTNYDDTCRDIAIVLKKLINAKNENIATASNSAMTTARKAAWQYFIEYYINSYTIALRKASKRLKN